ncbi:NUDIX domain-containing protein [Pseudarthrobacter oxydans]|uniref:NUDIX domain-containing protein n=1 Tax=Pseudarthrobacter oxydans TaxID=1671 RepID=UPI003D2C49DA
MKTLNEMLDEELQPRELDATPGVRAVVAVVLEWQDNIALFKRSKNLHHDTGLWHCITGFIEAGCTPAEQALQELYEETGLAENGVVEIQSGPDLVLHDDRGQPWRVHTFRAVSARRRLTINWEHDAYRWTKPNKTKRFSNRVSWLDSVLEATGHGAA